MKITEEEVKASFIHQRQITLLESITEDAQKDICSAILYLNTTGLAPITLLIDSGGGKVTLGEHICDTIRNSRAPVEALVIGEASSMTFVVLQSCSLRRAYEHARLMFHECRSSNVKCTTADKEKAELLKLDEEAIRRISKRSGHTASHIKAWMREERWFDAAEALRLGFIDEVVRPAPFPLSAKNKAATK